MQKSSSTVSEGTQIVICRPLLLASDRERRSFSAVSVEVSFGMAGTDMALADDREMPYLPAAVIAEIAQQLQAHSCWLFPTMALAGSCRMFREVIAHCGPIQELVLDDLQQAQPLSSRAALFRRANSESQRAFLSNAAGLLHGYGSLKASSSLINDTILMKVASSLSP